MSLDDTQVFLPEVWATHARYQPRKLAACCGASRQDWAALNASLNAVANRLRAAGIGRGCQVAVLMGNSIDTVHVMFGIVKAGACVVPISTMLTADQVATLLSDSGAVGLFAGASTQALAEAALRTLEGKGPALRVAVGFEAYDWVSYGPWIAGSPTSEPDVRYAMDDPFNIIYSSGTTGIPKGIVQTHRARQHWAYSNAIELRFTSESRALATTSLYSNGTWFMVLPPLFVGATMHVMEQFTPAGLLETIARERITHTFMVPTQFITTLAQPTFDRFDLGSLQTMLSAGSPLRDDTKAEILARMGTGLYELYGFSEGFATIIKPEDVARKPGSVGKPVLGFDLRILDEAGNELPFGEVGEIAGYGGGLMREYFRRPELTAEAIWRDARGRTFLRSGDIGRIDDEGFLYILDRKKDMILSGGFNVFPKDVEAIVAGHPDVQDVTVIGIPDPKWGEVPMAFVIAKAGASASPDAIRGWANERLAKPQRLAALEFRAEFPRNALGKVLKRELRAPYWQAGKS